MNKYNHKQDSFHICFGPSYLRLLWKRIQLPHSHDELTTSICPFFPKVSSLFTDHRMVHYSCKFVIIIHGTGPFNIKNTLLKLQLHFSIIYNFLSEKTLGNRQMDQPFVSHLSRIQQPKENCPTKILVFCERLC